MSAWTEARDELRDSRGRCLATLAAAYGCGDPRDLPTDVLRAIIVFGHECYQTGLAQQEQAHEAVTARPPPPSGAYRETPTRVDVVRRR